MSVDIKRGEMLFFINIQEDRFTEPTKRNYVLKLKTFEWARHMLRIMKARQLSVSWMF